MNNFSIYTYMPQNIYTRLCKCKKFEHVSVNDLYAIYTTIDTYTYNTGFYKQIETIKIHQNGTKVASHPDEGGQYTSQI
jgi:hypothetical protein